MLLDDDTIAAIATANGRGAIAVLRMSGPAAFDIARRVVQRWPAMPRQAILTTLIDPTDNHPVDQVVIVRFDSPHSYTGEAMVEIGSHGGIVVPAAVLRALLLAGAREARPGEFTQRAVLNGKIDLLQAEGIGELIDARTEAHRRIALAHVEGSLTIVLGQLQQKMLELEALLAYDLDFPDEDDGPIPRSRIRQASQDILIVLDNLLASARVGQIAKHGAAVVLAGRPNAGKSSLFNALAGEQRAIVTEHPGTTRDALEVILDDDVSPLRLIDTAGLRDTHDALEKIGVEVSLRHLASAAVVLVCGEQSSDIEETIQRVERSGTSASLIRVRTKIDCHSREPQREDEIGVSTFQRTGLKQLLDEVRRVVQAHLGEVEPATPVITRARQQVAIESAREEMQAFLNAWSDDALPGVVAAVHVRSAVHAMHELIGRIDTDVILGAVFERFCVGK